MAGKDEKDLELMHEIPFSTEELLEILSHEPKEDRVRLFLEVCDRGMKKIQEAKEIEDG
ncbi:hypothetical protein [Anaerovibrio sp.]|uniref:hypothetical protein n=1 Tax=Anaerovibrio sp. TaxID=1872532 RepID=UPI00388F34D5